MKRPQYRFAKAKTRAKTSRALRSKALSRAVGGGSSAPKVPAAPSITGVPGISGNVNVGETVSAVPALVTGYPAPTRSWQWVLNGLDISGATSQQYTIVAGDLADNLQVRQIETNSQGSDTALSNVAVVGAPLTAPSIPGVPTISGIEEVGEVLTAMPSTPVTGNPVPDTTWQWYNSASGMINGASFATYTLQAGDEGDTITVEQTESNAIGFDKAMSAPTGVIILPGLSAPVIQSPPTISGGSTPGSTLTASPGAVTGNPTPTETWQWNKDTIPIGGETGMTYDVVVGDVGSLITVDQTETNSQGSDTATSANFGPIADPSGTLALTNVMWDGVSQLSGDLNLQSGPATLSYMLNGNPTATAAEVKTDPGDARYDQAVTGGQGNADVADFLEACDGKDKYIHMMAHDGSNDGNIVSLLFEVPFVIAPPSEFEAAMWSLATGTNGGELILTIAEFPDDNGSPITSLEFDVGGFGTWVDVPTYNGAGDYIIDAGAAGTSVDIRIRGINSAGPSDVSDTKSHTTGVDPATVPQVVWQSTMRLGLAAHTIPIGVTVQAGDYLLEITAARGNDDFDPPTTPSVNGWNYIDGSFSSTNSSGARAIVFNYLCDGTETQVITKGTGNTGCVQVMLIRGSNNYAPLSKANGTSSGATVTVPGALTTGVNRLVVGYAANRFSADTPSMSNVQNGVMTAITEINSENTSIGGNCGLIVWTGEVVTAADISTTTIDTLATGVWATGDLEIWV